MTIYDIKNTHLRRLAFIITAPFFYGTLGLLGAICGAWEEIIIMNTHFHNGWKVR